MPDFLADYRAKFPEYDDINDDQLVSALNQKYNDETGSTIPLEEFKTSIGYQLVAPEPIPTEKPMLDLIGEKLSSVFGAKDYEFQDLDEDQIGAPEESAYRRFMGEDVPSLVRTMGARGLAGMEKALSGGILAFQELASKHVPKGQEQAIKEAYGGKSIADPTTVGELPKELRDEAELVLSQIDKDAPMTTKGGEVFAGAADSMFQQAPGLLLGILARSPGLAVTLMGTSTAGQTYGDSRARGLSPEEATQNAAFQGAVEAGTEMLPFMKFASMLSPGKKFSKKAVEMLLAEVPGEMVATALQNSSDVYFDEKDPAKRTGQVKEYLTSREHWTHDQVDTLLQTVAQSLLMAGGAAGGRYVGRKIEPSDEKQAGRALEEQIEDAQLPSAEEAAIAAAAPERAQIADRVKKSEKFKALPPEDQAKVAAVIEEVEAVELVVTEPIVSEPIPEVAPVAKEVPAAPVAPTAAPAIEQEPVAKAVSSIVEGKRNPKVITVTDSGAKLEGYVFVHGGRASDKWQTIDKDGKSKRTSQFIVDRIEKLEKEGSTAPFEIKPPVVEEPVAEKPIPAPQEAIAVEAAPEAVPETITEARYVEIENSAKPQKDISGKLTGWRVAVSQDGTILVHPRENKIVRFDNKIPGSGQGALRAKAEAQAYAIDNPVQLTEKEEVEDGAQITAGREERSIKDAQEVARRAIGAGAPGTREEQRTREEEKLKGYAIENGLTMSGAKVLSVSKEQDISGTDNHVYLEDGRFFKANKFTHTDTFNDYFDGITLHNETFPEAPYKFEGFAQISGELSPVVSQEFIPDDGQSKKVKEDLAAKTLEEMGYKRENDQFGFVSGAKFVKDNVVVRDINASNVAVVGDTVFFFDPVIEYEKEAVKAPVVKEPAVEEKAINYGTNAVDSFATYRKTIADQTATVDDIAADAKSIVDNKDKIITQLEKMSVNELNDILENPNKYMPQSALVTKLYEEILHSHVMMSGSITTFSEDQDIESQVIKATKEQTQDDVKKQHANNVEEATMNKKGEITYPEPEPDINTIEYEKFDSKVGRPAKDGERIFNAPGHNYVGLFRSTGIPARRESVTIEGRKLKIPSKPQRIEPIMRKLVKIAGRRIYFGKIKGKSSEGFYRPGTGEIRTRKKNDVEVLAHELAHYLDAYSNVTLPNFRKLYRDPAHAIEVESLSYTDASKKIQKIEGFAEFVRLWLTNSNEAQIRAPKFYEAFTNLLARDRKLLNPMRDMQDLMHRFYFQGPDMLGQALIGKEASFIQRIDEWKYRRDSRIRQQVIDRFHAARRVEQELTGKIGTVSESAWKQFRISNGGSEGIADYILNYGTVEFEENGDLKRNGKSLHDVLEPVKSITLEPKHKGRQKIDLLTQYLAGRRALELHRQGRENLIPKETAVEWAMLGKTYPVFKSIGEEYQSFNQRMLDFYEQAGMITPEGRKVMQSMNKDYVPFNRIRDQLAGGRTAGAGFQKLKGGTANLNDILVNIQDGVTANVRAALNNRAKQRMYQYIASHKDGAIFATKIAPDSKAVQIYAEEMISKINRVLDLNGIQIEGELDLSSKELLTFWQHGVKPRVNESGNIVDSVIINGKPKYYEVQDPLLQDMLLSMNPESYSSFMNVMFGIKNFFTRTITLGIEFTGANLVRDTTGAAFLSKNNFKPYLDSFVGMYSFFAKDEHYQAFLRSGGGFSSRIEGMTKEGKARRRVKVEEFGVMSRPEKLLTSIDNIMSAFEYGTRIGEFRIAKKNKKSDMDAGFEAREISTDFAVMGANRFLTGYIRTVPFLNAMIQSQDRVFREAVIRKKYDGNPAGMAMKAFLGITVPTLALYLINKDDEDYQAIPDHEKRTNWHFKIGDGQFIKHPRPYDVGFAYATIPELFFKYLEDKKGKEFAEGMIWTLTQMYGIDGIPAMMTGWWDIVRNKKWTGAPVVPKSLADVEATQQYSSNTSETFIRLGESLGVSPIKAEHMFKAYTGYLGGYAMWATDHMMWDEEQFGEKPDRKAADNIFLRRFLTTDVRHSTAAMEKFFDLKEKSDEIVATFKTTIDIRRAIKGKKGEKFKDDRFFGLTSNEKDVLFALNDSMNELIKVIYGKGGIKTAELAIKYDKKLTGEEKRSKMDQLWKSRNKAFMQYYTQADKAMRKAKRESELEK